MAELPPAKPATHQAWVCDYYEDNQVLYDVFWSDRATLSMGYGFWPPGTRTLAEAMRRQHEEIAAGLEVGPGDVVLEAGCGVGGATLHLVERRGARGVGITLSPTQARRGRSSAERRALDARAAFAVSDFLRSGFRDGAFTRVFACESACHATDKGAFLSEAFRVLRPGGRLLVCDGFLARAPRDAAEERAYREWCDGWALPGLASVEGFRAALHQAGFERVVFADRTAAVLPSARRIWWLGATLGSAIRALTALRLTPASRARHAVACLRQHQVLSGGLAQYGVFTAARP
jgi:cyclopropane fatty-acyl-phospholipid synthase-like methyltransferase